VKLRPKTSLLSIFRIRDTSFAYIVIVETYLKLVKDASLRIVDLEGKDMV